MAKDTRDVLKGTKVYRTATISIPDREKDEDPITKNQLRYIRNLSPGIEVEGGLENLGKWQASAIIDQIKEQKEKLETDIEGGYLNIKKGLSPKTIFWLIVAALIILYYLFK